LFYGIIVAVGQNKANSLKGFEDVGDTVGFGIFVLVGYFARSCRMGKRR